MEKPQIFLHIQKSLNYTAFDCKWLPRSARFVVLGSHAKGSGAFQIYEINGNEATLIKDVEKQTSFKCSTFGASQVTTRHLATGDFDGKLCVWDLESLGVPVYSVKAHTEIINAIDGVGGLNIGEGAPEIVTGSRDGSVKVWDQRQKDIPVAVMQPAEGETKRDCWCVAFGDAYNQEERCVWAGYDNGDIKMFDLRNMSLRWEKNIKNGVCGIQFDRRDIKMNKVIATSLESKFHIFDTRTQHNEQGFASLSQEAHKSTVWCVKHLPQNRDIFLTTGGSGTVNLWKYSYPDKRAKQLDDGSSVGVVGTVNCLQNAAFSTQPITSFDWNMDKTGLAVCTSFDQSVRVLFVTKLNTI